MTRAPREPIYAFAIGAGRVFFGAILRLRPRVTGLHNVPDTGGAVLAITHFGYMDFALTEWIVWSQNRRHIRFLAQKGAFDKPVVGWFLRGMRHISVDMSAGRDAFNLTVAALRRGELVGVFPEAGVSASFTVRELKTGAARTAQDAGVPIIPIALWGGQLLKTKGRRSSVREMFRAPISAAVGEPILVTADEDVAAATSSLRVTMQRMVDSLQADYPRDGRDAWWQPAKLGGAAPTPEVAAATEAERQRLKAARRAAGAAGAAGAGAGGASAQTSASAGAAAAGPAAGAVGTGADEPSRPT